MPGTASNLQAPSANSDNVDQVLAQGRPESRQQDSPQRALQLARQLQRQRLQRGDSRHGSHPAAGEQELVVLLHAHAATEPAERFPDRLSPHRLRHCEPVLRERAGRCRNRPWHPRLRRRHQVRETPAPKRQRQHLQRPLGGGTNWYQFDTTFQVSNVLVVHTVDRTTYAPDSICGAWRPAGKRPTTRAGASTSPATSAAIRLPTSCSGCRAP